MNICTIVNQSWDLLLLCGHLERLGPLLCHTLDYMNLLVRDWPQESYHSSNMLQEEFDTSYMRPDRK